MKRTPLKRKTALSRKAPLAAWTPLSRSASPTKRTEKVVRRELVESGIYRRPANGALEIGWTDAHGRQRWRTIAGDITLARQELSQERELRLRDNPNSRRSPYGQRTFKCAECKSQFERSGYIKTGLKVYCSKECALKGFARQGQAAGLIAAENRRRERVEIQCVVCGSKMVLQPSRARKRVVCSVRCNAIRMRESRKGSGNLNYGGGRFGQRPGKDDLERWRSALRQNCENPGCLSSGDVMVQHHVMYRRHVYEAAGDQWDPRNSMTLCRSCHQRHHIRSKTLDLESLPLAARGFVVETLGSDRAYEYLRRYYK